jgi:hypothetical protein
MVFEPGFNVIEVFQLAVLPPIALPPLALTPSTVTDAMPLLPNPLSLALPVTARLALVTVALSEGEEMVNVGACVSDEAELTVIVFV